MRPFAVPAELRAFVQDESVPEETARLHLATASGAVRTFCRWNLSAEQRTERVRVQRRFVYSPVRLWLRSLYVRDVVSLSTVQPVTLTVDVDYQWEDYGVVYLLRHWGEGPFTCVYESGYPDDSPEIDTIRGVVLAAAARLLANPTNLKSWTVGLESQSMGGGDDDGDVLSDGDEERLAGFVLPHGSRRG
jgi:hypothetical protein